MQLTDPHDGNVYGFDEDPVFSADGTKIAFARDLESSSTIWTMNADGSNQTQHTSGGDNQPAWSPDGTKIAFVRDCVLCGPDEVTSSDVYIMNADGSSRRDLTNEFDYNDFDPAWSPDGTTIAFASDRDGDFSTHIFKTSASGNGLGAVRLTNIPEVTDTSPAWSPAGGGIVFASDRSGSLGDIWTIGASGGGPRQLTTAAPSTNPQNTHPDWQPNPPTATIKPLNALSPSTDPGRFNLKIVGVGTVKAAAGKR